MLTTKIYMLGSMWFVDIFEDGILIAWSADYVKAWAIARAEAFIDGRME